MARSKTRTTFISLDSARKTTYKKRKASILRKVNEISTLCDVDACAIIFNPFNEGQAETSPQDPQHLQQVLNRYMQIPDYDKRNNMLDKVSFMQQMLNKAEDRLRKLDKDNMKKEVSLAISQYLENGAIDLGMDQALRNEMSWQLDEGINQIKSKLESMQLGQFNQGGGI